MIGPDADGLGLLLALEDVHQDGERGRHDEGGAEAHQRAEGDQLARRAGEGGQGGPGAEHHQAAQQHLLAAEPVTEQPRGEQEPGEDQGVGVDRPFQLALRGAQAGRRRSRDRLDRDVQDRVVEHHDQQAQHQYAEDGPAAPVHRFRDPGVRDCGSHAAERRGFPIRHRLVS